MIQNLTIGDLMIDCQSAERAREFYANLTGWERTIAYGCLAVKAYNGMTILFANTDIPYISPIWPEESGKQQKQMHFNFQVDDLSASVEEAIRLGATKAAEQYGGEHYVTMLDTEGYPFCLCRRGDAMMLLYHGTAEPNFEPCFGGGREYHDYGNGFYITEDIEAAKEWACQGQHGSAFVYAYELDSDGLNLLNLDENNTLAWVSILMTYRRSKKIRGAALERCNKMIERYGIDVDKYDIIRGFRANDSYFQFTTDFVTDTITLETLMKSIVAGDLGKQVCVKSEKAYQRLGKCVDVITMSGADYTHYHTRYLSKDSDARQLANDYSNEPQVGQLLSDILKGGAL